MKKHLEARRAKNRQLTQIDRANRCGYCFLDLALAFVHPVTTVDGRRFCSRDCAKAYEEWRR